ERYHGTSRKLTSWPFWYGTSTRSNSGMVKYGGTRLAAVPARLHRKPRTTKRRWGRATPTRRKSEEKRGWAARGAHAGHWPFSAVMGAPQLGQTETTSSPLAGPSRRAARRRASRLAAGARLRV